MINRLWWRVRRFLHRNGLTRTYRIDIPESSAGPRVRIKIDGHHNFERETWIALTDLGIEISSIVGQRD